MKQITIILLMLMVLSVPIHAVITFERWYGGTQYDMGTSVKETSDGYYIIAGITESFGVGWHDAYFLMTDSLGYTIWTKTYGGSSYDDGSSISRSSDGNYVMCGSTRSFGAGSYDVYLTKINSFGDNLWIKTYGGMDYDFGNSVVSCSDGGYAICGKTHSYGAGLSDVYLIKTNSFGDTLWTKTYGGSDYDNGISAVQSSDGGFIIVGESYSFAIGFTDVYLIKTDSLGDTLWTKSYGGNKYDVGKSVAQTSDKGYVIAGITSSFGAGGCDIYLIKTDSLGDTLWTKTFGGNEFDEGRSVMQTDDGGYIICGSTQSFGADSFDVYFMKTDSSGNTLWSKSYGGTANDWSYSFSQTTDGGFIIAGYTESFGSGSGDVYLIKTDSLGNVSDTTEELAEPTFCCYPNPFSTGFIIEYSGIISDPGATLKIYDSSGRLVKSMPLITNFLPLDYDLTNGIYFLKMEFEGNIHTQKLIKIK